MFSFLKRLIGIQPAVYADYIILARYHRGDWVSTFTVRAKSPTDACRLFDESHDSRWIRFSDGSIKRSVE